MRPHESLVTFLLTRASQEQKLQPMSRPKSINQLQIAVFPPLLQRPPTAGAGVEANDGSMQVKPDGLEVCPGAAVSSSAELEHVAVLSARQTEDVGHAILIGLAPLPLDVVEDTGFQPSPGCSVGRLHHAPRIEDEPVLSW